MLGSRRIALAALLVAAALSGCRNQQQSRKTLHLYAGAGLRRAVDALAAEFERTTGIAVSCDYSGSGILLSRAQADPDADLFLPGDVWYVDELDRKAGLIESKASVAYFVPVIIVARGNPKGIASLEDLLRPDVRVALGNPEACQIGRITGQIFQAGSLDAPIASAKLSLTVNELGVWVKMGAADAAVVWDAIAANIADSVETIEIPRERNVISKVVVGLMTTSRNKAAARQFVDFVTGESGQAILKEKGYRTEDPEGQSRE
jgi:molybdate transport system substrate-binding protein